MRYSASSVAKQLLAGDRSALSYSITLVESQNKAKRVLASEIVQLSLHKCVQRPAFKVAITGAPGSGKSCLLESLGMEMVNRGKRVAVLAIDPSSPTTKGSLLGDKTRMTELSRQSNAFVRPSPSNGWLGGVTKATGEATLLCEMAGYDVIFVETVGVGQSEAAVSHVTDSCTMVLSPNSGDELQALKRGVMELCDFFLINKCDGDLEHNAKRLRAEMISATKFMAKRRGYWKPVVQCVSAHSGLNIKEYLDMLMEFYDSELKSGRLEELRKKQKLSALKQILEENVLSTFWKNSNDLFNDIQHQVYNNEVSVSQAAEIIMKQYYDSLKS